MEINRSIYRTLAAAAVLCTAAAAPAQETPLRGTVNVDGRYLPDVIRQERINTLPRIYTFPMQPTRLPYEQKGLATPYITSGTPLPVTGWQTNRDYRKYRGYIDLSAGSWLNTSLSAGYRIIDNAGTSLGVWLQHNSTSLFHPHAADYADNVKRQRYDDVLGVDFSQSFDRLGTLNAALNYHFGYFNYYGCILPAIPDGSDMTFKAPTQTVNDLMVRAGWVSPIDEDLQYDATARLRYFGYRDLYLPRPASAAPEPTAAGYETSQGERETHFTLDGGVGYGLSESSVLGARLTADALGYSSPQWRGETKDGYGALDINPYYRFRRGKLNIHLGAKLDFTFGAGPKGDRFDIFHIAPDVRFDFKEGVAGIYLHLLGGTRLNTLASQADEDYYTLPALLTTTPVYSPIDGRLGVNIGPVAGISAGVSFAYKYARHQQIHGLYTYWMNNPDLAVGDGTSVFTPLDGYGMNIKGWSLQGNVRYKMGNVVEMGVDVSYQPQKGDSGYYNGMDRPRWIINAGLDVTPIENLSAGISCRYRGVRNAYMPVRQTGGIPGMVIGSEDHDYCAIRLPDITDLGARVAYSVNQALTVTVQADNILARKIQLMPGLKSEGLNLQAGVRFTF